MKKYALIIGNDTYDDPRFKPLCAPIADVKQLTEVLADPRIGSFTVQQIVNEQESTISRILERFFRNREREDLLLVHFSGHGIKDINGRLFLAVRDTNPEELNSSSIPARFLREQIDQCRSQKIFLILDCCYAGAFEEGTRGVGMTVGSQQAFEGTGHGRWIFTASDETQYAFEAEPIPGNLHSSVFTDAIVTGLREGKADKEGNRDGMVSVRDLTEYVSRHVKRSGYHQTPCLWTYKERGDLVIACDPSPELPPELLSDTRSRLVSIRSLSARKLGDLIRATNSSGIAKLAVDAIAKLAEDKEKRVVNSALAELSELAASPGRKHPLALTETLSSLVASFRESPPEFSDLSALDIILEVTHKLSTGSALEDIVQTLLEAAIRLTETDRGSVFLRRPSGEFKLFAGRERNGMATVNFVGAQQAIDAARSTAEFSIADVDIGSELELQGDDDYLHQTRRNTICFPLGRAPAAGGNEHGEGDEWLLYLEAKRPDYFSSLDHDLLRAIGKCATAAIENAAPVKPSEEERRYRMELDIARDIQQGLYQLNIPELSYAKLDYATAHANTFAMDLLDVIQTSCSVSLIVGDISGKGFGTTLISAMLRGALHSQLAQDLPVTRALTIANQFLCDRASVGRYATIVVASLSPNGELELVNCGHPSPILISGELATRLQEASFPIGLVPEAEFTSQRIQMHAGDRLLVVTDGVTEAMDPNEQFFGDERLEACSRGGVKQIQERMEEFMGNARLSDDFSIVELTYCPPQAGAAAVSVPRGG
jgi:sigma-B regulation protein RsbU (phosphoserine phosphatase)